jgi:hypothetical protein
VAKIERSRPTVLEWVAIRADMLEMNLSAPTDECLHCGFVALGKSIRVGAQPLEKRAVADN